MASRFENQINAVYTIREYLTTLNNDPAIAKSYSYLRPFEKTFDNQFANYMLCLMFVDNEITAFDVDLFNAVFETSYTLDTFKDAKSNANYNTLLSITEVLAEADLQAYKKTAYVSCGGTPISKTFIELVANMGEDIIMSNSKVSSSEKSYYERTIKIANSTIDKILGSVPGWKMGRKFTKAPLLPPVTPDTAGPDLSGFSPSTTARPDFGTNFMSASRALDNLMSSLQADLSRIEKEALEQRKQIDDITNFRPVDLTGMGFGSPITPGAPVSPARPGDTSGQTGKGPSAKAASKAEAKAEDKPEEPEKSLEELLEELNGLIGLNNIKKEVNSLTNLLKVNKIRKERNLPAANVSLHLVFYGNPGTGKTTVARLLAGIYKQLGFLSKGQCVEVDRGGLVGGFVGQTAIKTKEVIDSALGGILFIDEAYALTEGKGENDFGQEAVDTLLKAMEDNREDFVVIVAGYPDLMEGFINSNPGLKSRFTRYLDFKDYDAGELMKIFERFCKKSGFTCTDECKEKLAEYFEYSIATKTKNFANARFVRNTFEQIISNQADRLAAMDDYSDEELMQLIVDDLCGPDDDQNENSEPTDKTDKSENSEKTPEPTESTTADEAAKTE